MAEINVNNKGLRSKQSVRCRDKKQSPDSDAQIGRMGAYSRSFTIRV